MTEYDFLDYCEECGKTELYIGQFESDNICPECEGKLDD